MLLLRRGRRVLSLTRHVDDKRETCDSAERRGERGGQREVLLAAVELYISLGLLYINPSHPGEKPLVGVVFL